MKAPLDHHDSRRQDVRRAVPKASTGVKDPRWLTALLLASAGVGHLPVIPEHLEEAPYMGMLFVLFAVSAVAIAVALAVRGSALWFTAAGGLCLAAVLTYVATRLVPFPQLDHDVGAWSEPLGVLCVSVELAVIALTTLVLKERFLSGPDRSSVLAGRRDA